MSEDADIASGAGILELAHLEVSSTHQRLSENELVRCMSTNWKFHSSKEEKGYNTNEVGTHIRSVRV